MAGFAHYKSSVISSNKWEVLYLNLFDVVVTLPPLIAGQNSQLLMEEVTKISGLDVDKTPAAGVTQVYKGAQRTYSNAITDTTTIDVAMDMQVNLDDSNSAFAYVTLRKWCDLIWDPMTGAMLTKKDYTGGPMTVSMYNRNGDVYRQFLMPVIFPTTNISAMDLDYTGGGSSIYAMSGVTFRADYFENIYL